MGVCSAEERAILETVRSTLFEKLMGTQPHHKAKSVGQGDGTRCHGCVMSPQCFFQPLMRCARCNNAHYHSRGCQRKHWKHHKPTCFPPGSAPSLDASTYYETKAPTDPEARALMCSLNLESHPARGGTT